MEPDGPPSAPIDPSLAEDPEISSDMLAHLDSTSPDDFSADALDDATKSALDREVEAELARQQATAAFHELDGKPGDTLPED